MPISLLGMYCPILRLHLALVRPLSPWSRYWRQSLCYWPMNLLFFAFRLRFYWLSWWFMQMFPKFMRDWLWFWTLLATLMFCYLTFLLWRYLRFVTSAHVLALRKFLLCTLFLGFAFLVNQVDETFAPMGIDSFADCSATIACLYVHMSHLILCSVLFCISLILLFADNPASDSFVRFAVLYWHLVEIVWIIILLGLMCI